MSGKKDREKEPEPTQEVYVTCQDCHHTWVGMYLPQLIDVAAKIAKNLICPKCGAGSKRILMGQQLIGAAMALASDHPCSVLGHDWKTTGGRACPRQGTEEDCGGSQAVYECARCPEIDYGDPGGPGHVDCFEKGPCRSW